MSTAERTAAVEFARATAVRPQILGQVLAEIAKDPDVMAALFDVIETQKLLDSKGQLSLVPDSIGGVLPQLLAAR